MKIENEYPVVLVFSASVAIALHGIVEILSLSFFSFYSLFLGFPLFGTLLVLLPHINTPTLPTTTKAKTNDHQRLRTLLTNSWIYVYVHIHS